MKWLDKLKTGWSKISSKTKLIIIGSIAILFTFLFPIICNIVGKSLGTTIGTGVGTFYAVTEEIPKAYAEGKEEGLSAKDTAVGINQLKTVGKLDVLAAKAKMTDVLKDGDKYAALYELGADVIFSVDLTKANLLFGENVVEIVLPQPEVEFNFDSTKTRLIEDWKRWFGNGSTKDGLDAYINSMKQIKMKAKDQIAEYDYLEEQAKESAIKQVKSLAQLLVEKGTTVNVIITETEGSEQ